MRTRDAFTKQWQLVVSDHVTFTHDQEEVQGSLAKKGRSHAYVITDDHREFRVPYHKLEKVGGTVGHPVQTTTDRRRAAFHAGDAVQFGFQGATIGGVLVRLNPTRAHVVGEDGTEWRVPYARVEPVAGATSRANTARAAAPLDAIAHWATELMAAHALQGWSFQFDNSTTRAGACQYATQVLSLSFAFARQAPEEEIRETLLHEIAHALVGQDHHHDAVWRAQALEIGCSGRRCHELRLRHCLDMIFSATETRLIHHLFLEKRQGGSGFPALYSGTFQRLPQLVKVFHRRRPAALNWASTPVFCTRKVTKLSVTP